MNITRRQFIEKSLLVATMATMPKLTRAETSQPLFIPPLIEGHRGKPILLTMQQTKTIFLEENIVDVWGFNGLFFGPTVRVNSNDFVKLSYDNRLSMPVSITVQGLQASSEVLGGIGKIIEPNRTWSPILPIKQPAATCWYHANTLGQRAYQNYRGLLGMWIIDDNNELLPNKYGINDIPIILQDMQLNSQGVQLFHIDDTQFKGNYLFTNGQLSPFIDTTRGWLRLRILNASLSQGYLLQFDDNRPFTLIASDLGFLPQAKELNYIFVSPGERIEILVDLNKGGNVSLIVGDKRELLDKFKMLFDTASAVINQTILELRPNGLISVFNDRPALPATDIQPAKQPIKERRFHLDTENALLNERKFDLTRIDASAKLNSTERWILTTTSPTGFYIQGAKFLIESINDTPINTTALGWKDTIWVKGKISILVQFDNISSNNYPFTFGASDMLLADKGCLGMLIVQ